MSDGVSGELSARAEKQRVDFSQRRRTIIADPGGARRTALPLRDPLSDTLVPDNQTPRGPLDT